MQVSNYGYNQYNASFKGLFKSKKAKGHESAQDTKTTSSETTATVLGNMKAGIVPAAKTYLQKVLNTNFDSYYNCVYQPVVDEINALEAEYSKLSDEELMNKTAEFKAKLAKRPTSDDPVKDLELEKEALDKILPDAFATVREASKRQLGKRHHDVQLLGGLTLHNNQIAEMRTGEGKTLVATLPAYLNALTGKGVHVITVNDYLAKTGCEEMSKVFNALGLSVGCISSSKEDLIFNGKEDANGKIRSRKSTALNRKDVYNCDITYGTNGEFGFDYLRDNMAKTPESQVQRPFSYAIVDEVDSILIDDARTPLVIGGGNSAPQEICSKMNNVANALKIDVDYEVDIKEGTIVLTEEGLEKAQKLIGSDDLYDSEEQYAHRLTQALKAKELFTKNKDYVVQDGEIVIIDKSTGRPMKGRQWGEGLHQAVEAKEGVKINGEGGTLASITYQNLFRLYPRLGGMTGTALTEKEEFEKIYGLEVNKVPTNKPDRRIDEPDSIYMTERAKLNAIANEVEKMHALGRPVLIGTTSIEKSEQISAFLKKRGIEHNVLNAKQAEKEAAIIAQAGRKGAVTIATNMAGRGTDILLGGNAEFLAKEELEKQGITPENTPNYDELLDALIEEKDVETKAERKFVNDLGGLHVIGTEKHDSRRVDNQLKGRAARQGDNGSTKFFLSLEDDLIRIFGSEELKSHVAKLDTDNDAPIENAAIHSLVDRCQRNMEAKNFEIRKSVLEYDDILNLQRQKFYEHRNIALKEPDLRKYIESMIKKEAERLVNIHISPELNPDEPTGEALDNLIEDLHYEIPQLSYVSKGDFEGMSYKEIVSKIKNLAIEAYKQQELEVTGSYRAYIGQPGTEGLAGDGSIMRDIEKELLLRIADKCWVEHLTSIQALREGVSLRAYAGKKPLEEYKVEAFEIFDDTMEEIQSETVKQLFKLKFNTKKTAQKQAKSPQTQTSSLNTAEGQNLSTRQPRQPRNRNLKI